MRHALWDPKAHAHDVLVVVAACAVYVTVLEFLRSGGTNLDNFDIKVEVLSC